MRTLIILRGSPGCGKSTWRDDYNLSQYTLCPDEIRLLFQAPVMTPSGKLAISQKNDAKVWTLMFNLLEERMKRGELTVVDAVHAKSSDFARYKKLVEDYRYRAFCIDFTTVPKDVAKQRNLMREEHKRVPEEVIDNAYSRFGAFAPQKWLTVVAHDDDEAIKAMLYKMEPLDLSSYKAVHHIGDVHGCFSALKEYVGDMKDDEMYIFLGDFIDRGIENAEVVNFLFSIMDRKNVMMLEGNHEIHLWRWACGMPSFSNEFECVTRRELETKAVDKKMVRMLYRKLVQLAWYKYGDKHVLVTHGGVSRFPVVNILSGLGFNGLKFIATDQLIKGVGKYEDSKICDDNFNMSGIEGLDGLYQVHGHRNIEDSPAIVNDRCFNLEAGVEFGGNLRAVRLDPDGFKVFEIKNTVFRPCTPEAKSADDVPLSSCDANTAFVAELRRSELVRELKQDDGISSFNFKKSVFYDKAWDATNIRARGLFVKTATCEIVARSYDKFFNIGERPETQMSELKRRFKFPVRCYVKQNGFLGLIGYDSQRDELVITSKSVTKGDFVSIFSDLLYKRVASNFPGPFQEFADTVKRVLQRTNTTMVFEVVDPARDPHIIDYDAPEIVLLDMVKRQRDFERLPWEDVARIAQNLGLRHKGAPVVLNTWEEFYQWHSAVSQMDHKVDGRHVEGYVIEDSSEIPVMVKAKLPYYSFWKYMRSLKDRALKGQSHSVNQSSLTTPLANEFYGWLKRQSKDVLAKDIITLRKLFEGESVGIV